MVADNRAADAPVVFLMGPTASGKTELAARLCDHFPVELISVDAAQVYRGMDIGTAKPDKEFLARYPHHLVDIRDPAEAYSAADFVSDARLLIDDCHARGRIPLLVGGTMFYFNALEHGLSPLPSASDSIRASISRELQQHGVRAVHAQLQQIDAITAARMDPNDRQRVQRAMELYQMTGEAPHSLMKEGLQLSGRLLKMTLFSVDRKLLHQRIAERYRQMMAHGLVDEVRRIAARLEDPANCSAMRTVGYRQTLEMLRGETDIETATEKGIAATRQLAKRQLTWLRQQSGLVWFAAEGNRMVDVVSAYLDAAGVNSNVK